MSRVGSKANFNPVDFDNGCEAIVFSCRSSDVGEAIGDADSVTHYYTSRTGDRDENGGSWCGSQEEPVRSNRVCDYAVYFAQFSRFAAGGRQRMPSVGFVRDVFES